MQKKSIKGVVSMIVIVALLACMVPFVQIEDAFAAEANISARINGLQSVTAKNLSEVIAASVNQTAAISSIAVTHGELTNADVDTIRSHTATMNSLAVEADVLVSGNLANAFGGSAQTPNTKLQSVRLSPVTIIGGGTFQYCTGLSSVELPSVNQIGDNAFNGCVSMTGLTLGDVPPSVSATAFAGCPPYMVVYVPADKISLYDNSADTNAQADNLSSDLLSSLLGEDDEESDLLGLANAANGLPTSGLQANGLPTWNGFALRAALPSLPTPDDPADSPAASPRAGIAAIDISSFTVQAGMPTTGYNLVFTDYRVDTLNWYNEDGTAFSGTAFLPDTVYKAKFILKANDAATKPFDSALTAANFTKLNANDVIENISVSQTIDQGDTLSFDVTYKKTEDNIIRTLNVPFAAPTVGGIIPSPTSGSGYTLSAVWKEDGAVVSAGDNFKPLKQYTVEITAETIVGTAYQFDTNVTTEIGGVPVTATQRTQALVKFSREYSRLGDVNGSTDTTLVNISVLDAVTNQIINGADVTIRLPDATTSTDTVRNAAPVIFSGLPKDGEITIEAAMNGYLPAATTKTLTGGTMNIDIRLTPSTMLTVTVEPSSSVRVKKGESQEFIATVRSSNGIDLSGVEWSISGARDADTKIDNRGKLTVSRKETAQSITVTATSKLDNISKGTATVAVEERVVTMLASPLSVPVQIPVTGEEARDDLLSTGFSGKIVWSPSITAGSPFVALKNYTAKVTIKADSGYKFKKDTEITVTDSQRVYDVRIDKDDEQNSISFKVDFPSTFDPSYETQTNFNFGGSIPSVKYYGDSDFYVYTRGGNGNGAVTFKSTDEKVLKVTPGRNNEALITVMNTGNAKIIATKAGDNSGATKYNPISMESDTIYVMPRKLTARVRDLTIHEGSTPKFVVSVSGFVRNDSEASLKAQGYEPPVAECKETKIGNYVVKVGGGTPTANYEFDYYEGKLKIVSIDTPLDSTTGDVLTYSGSGIEMKIEKLEGEMFPDNTKIVIVDKTTAIDPRDKVVYDKNILGVASGKQLVALYDIYLQKDGIVINPQGKMKVTITVSDDMMKKYKSMEAIYIDGYGNVSLPNGTVEYNKVSFITSHFSLYGIIGVPVTASNNPQTGDSPIASISFIFVALGALGTLMFMPKKKRKAG